MEREHGGLIRGYLAARRDDAAAVARRASGARYDQFMAPKNGMSHLLEHLNGSLPSGSLKLNARVESIARVSQPGGKNNEKSWELTTNSSRELFDGW